MKKTGENDKDFVRTLSDEGTNQIYKTPKAVRTLITSLKNSRLSLTETWVSVKKGANFLGATERAVQKNCKNGKYKTRKISGNGGEQYEIALSSLPIEAQARYWAQEKIPTPYPSQEGMPTPYPSIEGIKECVSEKALARHDLLRLYEQSTEKHWGDRLSAKKEFIDIYNQGAFSDLLDKTGSVSFQTIERWRAQWIKNGKTPDALENKYHPTRFSSISQSQSEILLKIYLSPNRLPVQEAIRQAKNLMRNTNIPCNQSDMTFRRYLEQWTQENFDLCTIMREGEKALNDKAMPFIIRDREKIEVGDVLVADGHSLNFETIDPFTGKTKRMTLIGFIDMKSSAPVGFEIMPTENILAISSALRKSILTLGFRPRIVYLDNGRAFGAKYFTSNIETSGISGLFERLHIKTIFAEAYHAQSKTIERFFGSFSELERRLPSYTGTDIAHKPARMMRNEKLHKTAYQRLQAGAAPDIYSIIIQVREWIAEYMQRPFQDGFYKGRTALEVYTEGLEKVRQSADFDNRLINKEQLNFLMMSTKPASVQRNGVRFNNSYYWNEALFGMRDKVLLRVDFGNPQAVLVYDKDDHFICEARQPQSAHPAAILGGEDDQEQLARMIQAHRSLKKKTISQAKALLNAGLPTPCPPACSADRSQEGRPTPNLPACLPVRQTGSADRPLSRDRLSQEGIPTPNPSQEGIPTPNPSQEGIAKKELGYMDYIKMIDKQKRQEDEETPPIFLFEYEREAWLKKKAAVS